MSDTPFVDFQKLPRLTRDCVVTEKIDGTNAQIYIGEDGEFRCGSRNRWISPGDDNFGFAHWAHEHKEELMLLGPGRHFGEWWGGKIGRGYGVSGLDKRFSLFNVGRWDADNVPACCRVVPILGVGTFGDSFIDATLATLRNIGSIAEPGYKNPEGIVVFHRASGQLFKKTLDNDALPKGLVV